MGVCVRVMYIACDCVCVCVCVCVVCGHVESGACSVGGMYGVCVVCM